MTRVRISALAKQELRDILADLDDRAGPAVALRYAADFRQVYRSIAHFPDGGSPRPVLGSGVRIKVVYPYLVIYGHGADDIEVLRVLDGRREITPDLLGRG
jgi:toxin ParE1/3/4